MLIVGGLRHGNARCLSTRQINLLCGWTSSLELSAGERRTAGCCHIVVSDSRWRRFCLVCGTKSQCEPPFKLVFRNRLTYLFIYLRTIHMPGSLALALRGVVYRYLDNFPSTFPRRRSFPPILFRKCIISHHISMTLYLFSLLVITTHALHLMSLWSNHHYRSKSLTAPSGMLHLIFETSFLHHSGFFIQIIHPPLNDLHSNMPV